MDQKLEVSPVLDRIRHDPEDGRASLEDEKRSRSVHPATREEKIREASKPLYLKRYE